MIYEYVIVGSDQTSTTRRGDKVTRDTHPPPPAAAAAFSCLPRFSYLRKEGSSQNGSFRWLFYGMPGLLWVKFLAVLVVAYQISDMLAMSQFSKYSHRPPSVRYSLLLRRGEKSSGVVCFSLLSLRQICRQKRRPGAWPGGGSILRSLAPGVS